MPSVLDLVKRYQHVIEKYSQDKQKVLKSIDELFRLDVKVQHLQDTGVGRTVNALRKEPGDVGQAARALVYKWKLMVAAEEDQEDRIESTPQVGYTTDKEVDSEKTDTHRKSQQDKWTANGDYSASKRKYQSSEEEESDAKKFKHPSSSDNDDYRKNRIKSEPSDSESQDSDSQSDSEDESESYSEEEIGVKIKTEPTDKETTPKQSYSSQNLTKTEFSSSKRDHEASEPHSSKSLKHYSTEHKKTLEKSSKSSHYSKDKGSKESEPSSDRKCKEHKSNDKQKSLKEEERSSSNKHNSDRHKSSSQRSDSSSEKHKSHEKSKSEKHDKHSSSRSDKEKHKSSSEKEISSDKHKSKETTSSKEKSSSSKEKSKDRNSSSSSSKEKSSSKSEKKHSSTSDKSKSDSKNKTSGDKKERSSHKSRSSSSEKSKSSSSKSREDKPKKKVSINTDSDDGIGCESGASFAEALGMGPPSRPKKKQSSTPVKDAFSPNSADLSPASLLAPTAKLAPLPALEISALPEISPNYKPRPPPKFIPHFTEEDAMCMSISSKNQRTKVYSGNKVMGRIPTLYELCVNLLEEHIDALEYTGGVPYEILKPVVDKATPQQLFVLEHFNPYLMDDTDHLWEKHCQKTFRNKKRQEMETWREMYMRCQEEQESKLKSLTANIRMTQEAKKAPIKQTKMAYVDSVVKPPRNIARKQALHGTKFAAAASPAARVASLSANAGVRSVGRPAPVTTPTSLTLKPKKAPLMQKALQIMRGRKR